MTPIAIDFETSGLEYYRHDFEVVSCAFSWRDKGGEIVNEYVEGHQEIEQSLVKAFRSGRPIVVHNLQFELGVIVSKYPMLDLLSCEVWDTQRLCQVADGKTVQKKYETRYRKQGGIPKEGLSLEACCSRWLDVKYHDHKQYFYQYLREKCDVKAGSEGKHLRKLPQNLFRDYNCADTNRTLQLYEALTQQFTVDKYTGYQMDHTLYRQRCRQLVNARIYGVEVDQDKLNKCEQYIDAELERIEKEFFRIHEKDIQKAIQLKIDDYCNDPRLTDRGRELRRKNIAEGKDFAARDKICNFNIGSPKDLLLLYHTILNIAIPFTTLPNHKTGSKGGNASFKRAHLRSWHEESGQVLEDRGSLKFALSQTQSLRTLSAYDNRWHIDMNATGTKTGRLSGGGGE